MAKKNDLGKGIRALISNIESDSKSTSKTKKASTPQQTTSLPISYIEPNPFQPRRDFEKVALEELTESIVSLGIIQPITVKKISDKKYFIISGERRFRAATKAGLTEVPVHVRLADDQEMLEMALIENIQRSDLNALEVAISYQRLIDEFSLSHEEISKRVGKNRSSISNYIRLLQLSPSAQDALRTNLISFGHAKVLAGITDPARQVQVLHRIIDDKLSVRATERLSKSILKPAGSSKANQESDTNPAELKDIIDQLSAKVGSKVHIKRNQKGQGKIEINFKSDKDLNQLIENILD